MLESHVKSDGIFHRQLAVPSWGGFISLVTSRVFRSLKASYPSSSLRPHIVGLKQSKSLFFPCHSFPKINLLKAPEEFAINTQSDEAINCSGAADDSVGGTY